MKTYYYFDMDLNLIETAEFETEAEAYKQGADAELLAQWEHINK